MSEEGERGGRGTGMSRSPAEHEESAWAAVPEVEMPEPDGRTDFSMESASFGDEYGAPEGSDDDVRVAPVGTAVYDEAGDESAYDESAYDEAGDYEPAGYESAGDEESSSPSPSYYEGDESVEEAPAYEQAGGSGAGSVFER
ncbi:hypothetical protein ACFQ07_08055, partial [Actinomadura adrarensis]